MTATKPATKPATAARKPARKPASPVKVVKVDPTIASTAAALPADLWAGLEKATADTLAAAKEKRAAVRRVPCKLNADQVAALKAVKWPIPYVGQTLTVEFKVVESHYVTPLTAFYDRLTAILKANKVMMLTDVAVGYALAVKAGGLEKLQSRTVILKQVANRLGRNLTITENTVSL